MGHSTIVRGQGKLSVGKGPVRTGVTAIFPRGRDDLAPVFAGWFSMNGNGEMTGTPWIEDYGLLVYPVAITNTNSVGTVRDAIIGWGRDRLKDASICCLPVVAETWDGDLSDIFGFHVHRQHVEAALAAAAPGPVAEGNVGGGTGMICLGFKGGIGTASRKLSEEEGGYTVGVLVQCNFGLRRQLRIAGIPVGQEITAPEPCYDTTEKLDSARAKERCPAGAGRRRSTARSSWWWPPTPPSFLISFGGWPSAPRSASAGWAALRAWDGAISFSPFPPRRRARAANRGWPT